MSAIKKVKRILVVLFCLVCVTLSASVLTAYADEGELYLGGFSAGFILNTQNVEVIGLCDINSDNNQNCPARDGGIVVGDVIKSINGIEITSVKKLTQTLGENFSVYKFDIARGDEQFITEIKPIKDSSNGKKQFGMLVKDSLNGIGTVTYVDKNTNSFGSLGHPVTDGCGKLIKINGGTLYGCSIYDVKKGLRGNPGELKGIFDNQFKLGTITNNSNCGIYGKVDEKFDYSKLKQIKKGSIGDVEIGKANIYTTINGQTAQCFDVSIVKVDEHNKDNKNFVIKINDARLLDSAGGIVQGMSGSPIVQNGKLVGAITHVFVNDPTRGYGIDIDNMLKS